MSITNSELAAKLQAVADGWQSFVAQQIQWLVSTDTAVSLSDPYNSSITVSVKPLQKLIADFDALFGPASTALTDANALLTSAIDASAALSGVAATVTSLRDEAQSAAASAASSVSTITVLRDQTSVLHSDTQGLANSAASAMTDAQLARDGAAASAAAAATDAANADLNAAATLAHRNAAAASEGQAATHAAAASSSATSAASSASSADAAKVSAQAAETAAETAQAAAESAQSSAAASATSASSSASSATVAKNAAETAKTTAEAAATSAGSSAGNAATSASNAATSATAAATSATNAASSATAAAGSATSADASKIAAQAAKTAAELAETNAETAEANATASKNAAATSATNAASSATAAATSASNAAASATASADSATAADAAKVAAETARDEAQAIAGGNIIVSQISDFAEGVDDRVAALVVTGSTRISVTYNDANGTLTFDVPLTSFDGRYYQKSEVDTALAGKQASLGFTPANKAGDTFTGKVTTLASAAGSAGFSLPHGSAPTSPANGDMWSTTADLFVRLNGSTKTMLRSDTYSTVTQAEAEAGSATTVRWWTAQRVRQAIALYSAPVSHTHTASQITDLGSFTGFDVRYYTEAEVDTLLAAKLSTASFTWSNLSGKPSTFAPSAHSHALSELTQSGAATGQVPVWSGSAWVPGDASGGMKWRIATTNTALDASGDAVLADCTGSTLEMTLPLNAAATKRFAVHAFGGTARIVSNGNVIDGVGAGNNLTVADGETVYLVARATGYLRIT